MKKNNVGRRINTKYCDGVFFKGLFMTAVIEAEGTDWVVIRDHEYNPWFTSFMNTGEKQQLVDKWCQDEYRRI